MDNSVKKYRNRRERRLDSRYGKLADSVEEYRNRRQARLDERFGVPVDIVEEYRKRREQRLDERFNEDAGVGWVFGILKKNGIDTEGMTVPEAFEELDKLGGGKHGGSLKRGNIKGGKKKEEETFKQKGEKHQKTASGSEEKHERKTASGLKLSQEGYVDNWKPPEVKGMSEAAVNKVLSSCHKIGGSHYDKGTEVAKQPDKSHLWTYTSHGLDHVQQVIDKTNQAADAIEKLPADSAFKGAKIDRPTMLAAAWFHDTGMDGGDDDWSNDDGNGLREAHGKNSMIHILQHANEIGELGVDPYKVAMAAYAHTKSMSGIGDLTSPKDWEKGVTRMEEAVKKYNARHEGEEIDFDREKVEKAIFGGKPDKDNIHEMAATVAAIRLGDANREAGAGTLRSQSGGDYKIETWPKGQFSSADEEAANSKISITEDGVRHELSFEDDKMKNNPGHPYSKKVVLGEQNMVKVDTVYNGDYGTLQEEITLDHGEKVPHCTINALLERCGELNTVNGIPRAIKIKMTGVKNWDALDDSVKDAYMGMWDTMQQPKKNKKGEIVRDENGKAIYPYVGVENLVLEFNDNGKITRRAAVHGFQSTSNNRRNNR